MIAFGFGEIIGGLLMGKIFDYFGARRANFFNILMLLITCGVTLFNLYELRYNWATFVMTFIWGVQDSFYNIFPQSVLGSEFESKSEPYGVFNSIEGISVFVM